MYLESWAGVLQRSRREGLWRGSNRGSGKGLRGSEGAAGRLPGSTNGKAIVDAEHYDEFRKQFDGEKPDIVFVQWPIDKHRDHRALSNLVLDAWMESGKKAAFYYYDIAEDTMMFTPAEFVDITAVEARKRTALFCTRVAAAGEMVRARGGN